MKRAARLPHRFSLPLALAFVLPLATFAGGACEKDEPPATTNRPAGPTPQVAPVAPRPVAPASPAPPPVAPASSAAIPGGPPAPPPPGMPIAADDPIQGVFTLAEATYGLPPAGDLSAQIDVEQGGKRLGRFVCKLDAAKAPFTVANFVGLARGVRPWKDPATGEWVKRPFFDGLIFQRVIPGFMVQGGDPTGSGAGDGGFAIPDEWNNGLLFDKPGLLAMANKGHPFTAGSQFFITETVQDHLNPRPGPGGTLLGYTIFGSCTPVELVKTIGAVPVDSPMHNLPTTKVVMEKVTIRR